MFPRNFFLIVLSLILSGAYSASANEFISTPARQAIILDYESGTVLYQKNAYEAVPPASMSKLMTLAVVFDYLQAGKITLDTKLYVSEKAWRKQGSKMFVLVDTHIAVRDLIAGVIVMSGNDACIVIAENLSSPHLGNIESEEQLGSEEEFAGIMNAKAREWGLSASRFANPTGLPDPNQLMSMFDLAQLTSKIITDYNEFYSYFSQSEFTWSGIRQENRNPLLKSFDGADGMKTGHTEESGFGLVGTAVVDGKRRIIVVHGLDSLRDRARESTRMMRLSFSEFDSRNYYSSGDLISSAEIYMGTKSSIQLKIKSNVNFTMNRKALDSATAKIVYQGPIKAPVQVDEQVALLQIEIPGMPIQEYPLYAAESVKRIGFFGKVSIGLRALLTPPSATEL